MGFLFCSLSFSHISVLVFSIGFFSISPHIVDASMPPFVLVFLYIRLLPSASARLDRYGFVFPGVQACFSFVVRSVGTP